jgi:hypothetical protein
MLKRAASVVENNRLSNHPKRRRPFHRGAGRITVNAREQELTAIMMHHARP